MSVKSYSPTFNNHVLHKSGCLLEGERKIEPPLSAPLFKRYLIEPLCTGLIND